MQTNTRISHRNPNDHSSYPSKKPEQATSPSTVAPLLSFFLLLSVTANIALLSGCRSVHDLVYGNPCEYQTRSLELANGPFLLAEDESILREKMVKLATIANVEPGTKNNAVLAGDIVASLEKEKRRADDRLKVLRTIDIGLGDDGVESKTDDDLIADIQERIRELQLKLTTMMESSSVKVPSPFSGFDKMAESLSTPEEMAMRTYHSFITGLQGKRVIILEPGD